MRDTAFLEACSLCPGAPVESSATFDINLGTERKNQQVDVSFALKPQAVDRFTVRVYAPYPQRVEFSVYSVQLKLVHDEDNKETFTDPFLLTVGNYDWAILDLGREFEDWNQDVTPDVYFSCNDDVVACVKRNELLLSSIGYKHAGSNLSGPSR